MHHQIDALAYTNRLRSLPPEHKLIFAIALFGLSYVAPIAVQILVTVWLGIWIVGYARIPVKIYRQLLFIPLSFWLVSVPALAIGGVSLAHLSVVQEDVWQGIKLGSLYLYISQQGIEQARELLTRSIALTSCMYFILLTIPFAELLRILKRCGCPTLITELLALMYRFIFVLTETASELLTAQQARIGYGNWRTGMRSLALIASQLLRRTLENYRQISMGLESRGFRGELRFWHSRRYRTNWRYIMEAVGGYVILLVCAGWHYAHGI
jgi:cobalt/nickel transport system permease protein